MAFLTRDQILDADDRDYETVACPEWGGDVRLSSITGGQRDKYESSLIEERGGSRKMNLANARSKLIVLCAVDENGRQLFSSEDVARLARKSAKPIDRLFTACQRLAGISDEDVDRLTEDFGATQGEGSDTD